MLGRYSCTVCAAFCKSKTIENGAPERIAYPVPAGTPSPQMDGFRSTSHMIFLGTLTAPPRVPTAYTLEIHHKSIINTLGNQWDRHVGTLLKLCSHLPRVVPVGPCTKFHAQTYVFLERRSASPLADFWKCFWKFPHIHAHKFSAQPIRGA